MAGEHVTTQHKPVVFVFAHEKRREVKSRDRKTIRCGKCRDNVAVAYKKRMNTGCMRNLVNKPDVWRSGRSTERHLEELQKFLCGMISGKGVSGNGNQVKCTQEVAKVIGKKKKVWKRIE